MLKNKGLIAVIVVIVLLLLGTGAYLMLSRSSSKIQPEAAKQNNEQPKTQTAIGKSLMDLLASGQTQQCTFSSKNANGTNSQATVYVSNGKVRGSFNVTTADGKENKINMIRNGDTNYVWGGTLPQGIKITMSLQDLSNNQQANQYVNPNQKTNYSCSPWVADDSIFAPPSDIKFMDFSQMIQQAKPSGSAQPTVGSQTQTGSSPCDSITDTSAKAACVKAMQQNGY